MMERVGEAHKQGETQTARSMRKEPTYWGARQPIRIYDGQTLEHSETELPTYFANKYYKNINVNITSIFQGNDCIY